MALLPARGTAVHSLTAVLVMLLASVGPPPAAARVAAEDSVVVAVANLREGGLDRQPVDLRHRGDMRAFADRLLEREAPLPDVVLVQEVLGSEDAVADVLTAHPAAERAGARYLPVTTTRHRFDRGRCQGPRDGRFSLLKGAAILVNAAVVPEVLDRGVIRTWGRWNAPGRQVTGRDGYGCTAQPWARLLLQRPGQEPMTALVSGVHVAPAEPTLKTLAAIRLRDRLAEMHQRHPEDLLVLAGDLNLSRCDQPTTAPERDGCPVRAAHRELGSAGLVDAVRDQRPTGPEGVVGVGRRVDFVYTPDAVSDAWFDRCYMGWLVRRWRCEDDGTNFTHEAQFYRCQTRALEHGRAGGGCSRAQLGRYYSDHPMLVATVTRRPPAPSTEVTASLD